MKHSLICAVLLCTFTTSAMAKTIEMPEFVQKDLFSSEEIAIDDADDSKAESEATQQANPNDPEEPVTTSTLKVIGRGLENRRTHDVIMLACVGQPVVEGSIEPSCSRLRHVKYKAETKKMVFAGKTYKFDHEPTEQELEKQVKAINKSVRKYRNANNGIGQATYAFTGFGAILIAALTLPTGIAMSIGAVYTVGLIGQAINPLQKSGAISQAMANKDGWNWSTQPKKVSARTFHWVEGYLAYNYLY